MKPAVCHNTMDWNRAWKEMMPEKPSAARRSKFWDARARSFARHVSKTGYADSFLRIMNPEPDWRILDMGCGGGTLALPLSDKHTAITAMDDGLRQNGSLGCYLVG